MASRTISAAKPQPWALLLTGRISCMSFLRMDRACRVGAGIYIRPAPGEIPVAVPRRRRRAAHDGCTEARGHFTVERTPTVIIAPRIDRLALALGLCAALPSV